MVGLVVGLLVILTACASDPGAPPTAPSAQASASVGPQASPNQPTVVPADEDFPDVLAATATMAAQGVWQFSATLSSPYDSPDRYADAWRVVAPSGAVLGVRELLHDHAGEQPFTRTLGGVEVPEDVDVVTVEGRDQVNGWGGETVQVELRP